MQRLFIFLLVIATAFYSVNSVGSSCSINQYFNHIKNDPNKLSSFIKKLPKGGLLHSHLSGAVAISSLIKIAKHFSYCIDPASLTLYQASKCKGLPSLTQFLNKAHARNQVTSVWTLEDLSKIKQNNLNEVDKHFFASFYKYLILIKEHRGYAIAAVKQQAANNNVQYLELMISPHILEAIKYGKSIKLPKKYTIPELYKRYNKEKIDRLVDLSLMTIKQDDDRSKQVLHCNRRKTAYPACKVKTKFLYQIIRNLPPNAVFSQMLVGFELANRKQPYFVGINLVGPESNQISVKNYDLQMKMIGFLHEKYPNVKVSLHAGELNLQQIKSNKIPANHILKALLTAKANRIGHGVDIRQEVSKNKTLYHMMRHQIAVEINLTSNQLLLGTNKSKSPFIIYFKHNIPVVISTDDAGILQTNMTKEFIKAIKWFNLAYKDIITLIRNSLTYSFIPGNSYWENNNYSNVVSACKKDSKAHELLTPSCKQFLANSEKATSQWHLEQKLYKFTQKYTSDSFCTY